MGWIVSGVQVSASFQIIPCLMGRLGSEVRVSVSFQTIPCLMGRLGLEVRVSDSSRSFDLRMFVCHGRHVFAVSSAISCARKVIFLSCPVMFSEDPTMSPLRVLYRP